MVDFERLFAVRPLTDDDLMPVYEAVYAHRHKWWRVYGLGDPTPEQFPGVVRAGTEMVWVLEEGDERIGVASLFDFNAAVGSAWVDLVLFADDPDAQVVGVGLVADEARRNWGVSRLYAGHHEFEESVFPSSHFPEAMPLGTLPEAHWAFGRHWDRLVTVLAVPAVGTR